jgi:hypothetical protein
MRGGSLWGVRTIAADYRLRRNDAVVPAGVCGIMRQKNPHGGNDDKTIYAP